jgi:hypothetical protein
VLARLGDNCTVFYGHGWNQRKEKTQGQAV